MEFGAGEPDFDTPEHIKAAAHAAIDSGLHEVHARGRHERAEAGDLRRTTSTCTASTTRPTEVIVTAGGKQALYNVAMALFAPGDEVITHAPCWPTITEQVKLADATPVLVQTYPEDGFAMNADAFLNAVTPSTRGHHHQLAVQSDRRADGRRARWRRLVDEVADTEHLDHPRPVLRAADLRAGAAQPAEASWPTRCGTARSSAGLRRSRTR